MSTPALSHSSHQRRALTVIFKGSNRCNAGCTYCSVGEAGGRMISADQLDTVIAELDQLVQHWGVERLGFTFHGGEPTLLGPSFIDDACARLRQLPATVSFSMQSNLLAWNEAIEEVLIRNDITVGTSIDPIARERLDGRGQDAFPGWLDNYTRIARVMRAPGAIFVVTRKALGQASELYDVAQSISDATGQRFGLQVNPVYRQGKAAARDDVCITPEDFGEFLIQIWQAWEHSEKNVRLTPIQDFADFFFPMEGETPVLSCSFKGNCARHHVGIDFDLNVAGCGRRLDSGAYLGNLAKTPLVEILEGSEELRTIECRNETLRQGACRNCRFFVLCNGGCPDDAAIDGGGVSEPFQWCAAYRMLFERMEAARADRGRPRVARRQGRTVDPTLQLAIEPGEVDITEAGGKRLGLWLLPTRDGRALRFDGGLREVVERYNGPKRLFVVNERVPSLALWEEALQRSDVSVVLFAGEGLEAAVDVLAALGANVILDVQAIIEARDGGPTLARIVERFVHEQKFGAKIYPFATFLLRSVHRRQGAFANRYGLKPGAYVTETSPLVRQSDEPIATGVVTQLLREEGLTVIEWLNDRLPCRACSLVDLCGGQLAKGDGKPCPDAARELVARIAEVGKTLRQQLAAIRTA